MFLGSSDHVLDDKGRTSLPKDFRDILSREPEPAFLTAKPRCLAIYSAEEFQRLCDQYADLHIDSRERLERLHIGNAQRLTLDKQGRILISPSLRRLAGLQREIMFLGVGQRIEIWDRSRYDAEQQQTSDEYAYHTGNRKDSR